MAAHAAEIVAAAHHTNAPGSGAYTVAAAKATSTRVGAVNRINWGSHASPLLPWVSVTTNAPRILPYAGWRMPEPVSIPPKASIPIPTLPTATDTTPPSTDPTQTDPSGPIDPPPTDLTAPVLSGDTKTVDLTIGAPTSTVDQPLGITMSTMSAWGQGNVVNEMITQGGSFESGEARLLATASSATSETVVIHWASMYSSIGYTLAVGEPLVGMTGANAGRTYQIFSITDELDSNGNATGDAVVTIVGSFATIPAANDEFYIDFQNDPTVTFADVVSTTGNTTIARDYSTAYVGSASGAFTFGSGANNTGTLKYYFGADSGAGRNILQLGHTYQLSFWAKTTSAATANFGLSQGNNSGWNNISLVADGNWHQYTLELTVTNPVMYANGTAQIDISGANGKVNVDVVQCKDLSDQISPTDPISKETVDLIKEYGFSTLRFWDANTRFVTFDNMIGAEGARKITSEPGGQYDPILGLPEMLQLCKDSNTDLWITIPVSWTATDLQHMLEYLGGSVNTVYGAKRAADGHLTSWFDDIKTIHIEAGDEAWNGGFYPNAFIYNFGTYFTIANNMFTAIKADPLYATYGSQISLVANGWQGVPWFTQQAIQNVPAADAIDVAAYTGGPTTVMPLNDILGGAMAQAMADNSTFYPSYIFGDKKIMIYEEAPGELNGDLDAATESAYATSLAAALANTRNAMVLERDYGMTMQNLFDMYGMGDNTPEGYALGHYGIFKDMTTATTTPRPRALAAKLFNQASGTILSTSLSSGWVIDSNSSAALATTTQAADAMVTYNGSSIVITLFNETIADDQNTTFHFTLPATIDGHAIDPDWSKAMFSVLNGDAAASNNETSNEVTIQDGAYTQSGSEVYASLAGHSMGSLVIPLN